MQVWGVFGENPATVRVPEVSVCLVESEGGEHVMV